MMDFLKEMILDFQDLELETGVPRRVDIETVPGKATICIGARRSGKSTFLFQLMSRLIEQGVDRRNILYLNFFDDRLRGLRHERPGIIAEAYFSLYPEKKNVEKIYCFFDEIQEIPDWEPFVDRLMRQEKCDVFITGSSARMLSREIATQMRGRALSWEIFPFSFQEFLDFKGIQSQGPLSAGKRLMIQKAFGEYWETGGFPEVAGLGRRLRVKIHQEYFNAMLFRDIVERHDISHPRAVADLARRLVDNAASLYSINRLAGYLKSLGHKAPKSAVSDYLSWFEDAYVLFTTRIFDASQARAAANPKKIYCVDHALATSISSGILLNSGHLLENLVFTTLRRLSPDIFYFKSKNGREVDFVVRRPDRSPALVQVCESMADPKTRKREIKALGEAMSELGIHSGTIVTRGEESQTRVESGEIRVTPAWRFLLEWS
ncbi:ATPase AAA [Candidatus Desulfarcum epimagneticum]|uniref:ATPase AAA n=1 Tax=uncultured Desulfobacteraceae bacterium TaxID=218296 RepID=A0A484HEL8_9BACT|nr:ATPase AAA [uncultured Desulfobacteraceae bacterium]